MKINQRVVIMREAIVKIIAMLANKSIKVTQQGSQAYVDYNPTTLEPRRINLPYIPDDATDDLLDAVQGFLDHEVAHILFTDAKQVKRAKSNKVAGMANILEDCFIERRMCVQFRGSAGNLAKVGQFVLDTSIDPELKKNPDRANATLLMPIMRALSGQQVFKDYMSDKWDMVKDLMAKLGDDMPAKIMSTKSSEDCTDLAIEIKHRLNKHHEPKEPSKDAPKKEKPTTPPPPPPEGAGEDDESVDVAPPADDIDLGVESDDLTPGGVDMDTMPETEGDSKDESEDADEKDPAKSDDEESDEDEGEDADAGEDSEGKESEGSEPGEGEKGDEAEAEPESKDEGSGISAKEEGSEGKDDAATDGEGDESSDAMSPADDSIPATPDEGGDASEEGADDGIDYDALESEGAFKDYDEMMGEAITKDAAEAIRSAGYSTFTKDYDTVEPLVVNDVESARQNMKEMQERVDGMVGVMQKEMERIMQARSQAVWTGGHRSGRLHGAGLARLHFGRDDVFRRKQVSNSKDVAVELLVDASGSMRCGGRIVTAGYAAYAIASVLQRMGITHEILAFTTKRLPRSVMEEMEVERSRIGCSPYSRKEALYMPVLKGFNETMDVTVRERIAALQSEVTLRENVDGECVQIAAMRLSRRREARKIMMVLSDGEPYCAAGVISEQATHLKDVTGAIESRGQIDLIGIGIQTHSVKRFYKNNVVLNDLDEMPSRIMLELKKLLFK